MNEQHWPLEKSAQRRVLVVDDDHDFADTLARLLALEGYEVRRAYNLLDAQAELDRFSADVLLIDIRMGEHSGLSLVSALRRQRPEVICIIMTAYGSVQTAVQALQEGATDYLCKPFYTEHVLATLEQSFERIALTRAHEQAESALKQRNRELEALNKRLAQTESVLRQRNRELEGLNARLQKSVHSMRVLATFTSLRELCAAIHNEVADNMNAAGSLLYFREEGRLVPASSSGQGDFQIDPLALETRALRRGGESSTRDSAPDYQAHKSTTRGPEDEKLLAFPLIGEKPEPVGLLVLYAGPDRVFTQQDRELGEILVSFAGEAIRLVQALENLAWSEERLRNVIDNSPSSISLKDLQGRFVIVNRCFEEWYGFKQDDVFGKTSQDLFPTEIARHYTAQWEEALTSHTMVDEEIEVPFADGKLHSLLVTKFPVLGATGQTVGVGTIATDITASRRAEEQLRQAQKTEALGQLTGGIAHDFNNLLAVISGNLDLLMDELKGDRDLSELLEDALSAAHSGAELTHRLLAFGRRQTLHPQITNAGKLVAGMSRMLERTLGETIETRRIQSEQLWAIEVDQNQLETSLLNLTLNARDAMSGGGMLTIETANTTFSEHSISTYDAVVPGDYVVVSVTDNGSGMAADVVERAIEPFFTSKDVGHGSGLGLSMVYGFVKQSGGHLEISSTVGKGTTVALYLPRAEAHARESEIRRAELTATGGSGERILVVEDKPDVRRLVKRILTQLGYEVLEAEDGKMALDSLDSGPKVDLLFTDVVLPGGISGADLAKEAQARHPALKVLYTSGYANDAVLTDHPSRGAIRFIKKPFAKEGLARMVRHALADSARDLGSSEARAADP